MSHVHRAAAALVALAAFASPSLAQTAARSPDGHDYALPHPVAVSVGAPSADSLATLVLARFASGTLESFDSIFPDPLGRAVMHTAVQRKQTRIPAIGTVLWRAPDRAVLLIAGTVRGARSGTLSPGGDETNIVRRLSGLYLARRSGDAWMLERQIPIDSANFIRAQAIHATLAPGQPTRVVDTLTLEMGAGWGFTSRFNNAARLASVSVDGKPAKHEFGGGILWVDAPARARSSLVLAYDIPPDSVRADSSGNTLAHGALENTDAWLPFFGYDATNGFAQITVTATIPAEYKLTTSLPQTESVRGGMRVVHGTSILPQFIVSLIYDRDWQPTSRTLPHTRLETFFTPAFRFTTDSLAKFVTREYGILVPRFGEPQAPTRYLAIVEHRGLRGSGFTVRMNNAVVAGDKAILLDDPTLGPSSSFAHEVAHGWTMSSTGPAANFLQEGWATYAESLILRELYGAEVEKQFWERVRAGYVGGQDRAGFLGGFEGRQSILGDPDNGRIHYTKGSWIYHSLNVVLGDSVFDRAMRMFVAHASHGPNGYRELIADMSKAAGRDMTTFIMPWLSEKYIPDVDATVENGKLVVTQSQPSALFDLPLDVELTTASGKVRRAVHLTRKSDTVSVADLGAITAARVDPDHHFLLKRHWGDVARFELIAPDAKSVELTGSFLSKPVPATREGDRWVVTLPLTEGRYLYQWRIDGKSATDEETLAAAKTLGDPHSRLGILAVPPTNHLSESESR